MRMTDKPHTLQLRLRINCRWRLSSADGEVQSRRNKLRNLYSSRNRAESLGVSSHILCAWIGARALGRERLGDACQQLVNREGLG